MLERFLISSINSSLVALYAKGLFLLFLILFIKVLELQSQKDKFFFSKLLFEQAYLNECPAPGPEHCKHTSLVGARLREICSSIFLKQKLFTLGNNSKIFKISKPHLFQLLYQYL